MHRLASVRGRLTVVAASILASTVPPSLAEDEVVLLGPLTRTEIESALPDWVTAELEASPDTEAASELATSLSGTEITVFLGTWCSDSRRLLSRLWRALDDTGLVEPPEIRYIGIDRSKRQPSEWVGDTVILLVPTLIVRREGREIGRIVETAPNGIEWDLAAILAGRETGVITGSADALAAAAEEEHP